MHSRARQNVTLSSLPTCFQKWLANEKRRIRLVFVRSDEHQRRAASRRGYVSTVALKCGPQHGEHKRQTLMWTMEVPGASYPLLEVHPAENLETREILQSIPSTFILDGATTLIFVVNGANAVCLFVMRSTFLRTWWCRLTTRHQRTTLCECQCRFSRCSRKKCRGFHWL